MPLQKSNFLDRRSLLQRMGTLINDVRNFLIPSCHCPNHEALLSCFGGPPPPSQCRRHLWMTPNVYSSVTRFRNNSTVFSQPFTVPPSPKSVFEQIKNSRIEFGLRASLLTAPEKNETVSFQCLGLSIWTICSLLSQFCSNKFPTFSLS